MELCSSGHEEIVHENYDCPLCTQINEVTERDSKIVDLEAKVSELEDEVINLKGGSDG